MQTIKIIFRRMTFKIGTIKKILFYLMGFLSLIWFLIRVIPKPSRALYPCQRIAFPIASSFVIWICGIVASSFLYVKAKVKWRNSKYLLSSSLFVLSVFVFISASTLFNTSSSLAFFNTIQNGLVKTSFPPIKDHALNVNTVEPSSVVGVSKSAEPSAELIEDVESLVREAIEKAGGLDDIVHDGHTVVLKPNLIASQDFTATERRLKKEANGVTTDYRVIQAVVDIVRELNPNGKIVLIEGSGVGSTRDNMEIVGWTEVAGLDSIIYLEECGDWFDTTSTVLQGVSLPAEKRRYPTPNNRYWLNKLYYEADVLISLPVLKNHLCTGVTGAVKNVGIGATPTRIYGVGPQSALSNERWDKIDHGFENSQRLNLHYWIHDFYLCRPVDFVVMDGLQGIQNGPLCHAYLNDTEFISEDQMNMRLILASKDPIAIDAVSALLAGHDPLKIPHLTTLHNDSAGCCDSRLIRVQGIKVGDEKRNFEINDSGKLSKYDDFIPPVFSVDSCSVSNNQLGLNLTVDNQVTKVEVMIDGQYLNQIRVENFDHFYFDLGTLTIDQESEIIVFAYDQYLNYSSHTVGSTTSVTQEEVEQDIQGVDSFVLSDNYPNPFNISTKIEYEIPRKMHVNLSVYDVTGKKIITLMNEIREAGHQSVSWNGLNQNGNVVPSGVYFYRMQTNEGYTKSKRMVLIK